MIALNADHLPVTSDSEPFSYLGQNVKVPALLFAVLMSRLGTAFIVQKYLTLGARKTIRLLIAALTLILTASHSQADLGWTLAQIEQQYGHPALDQEQIAGRVGYVFTGGDYIIATFFRNTQVSRILYICRGGSVFDWAKARALLVANAPDAIWDDDASRNEADKSYRVNGTKDGVENYYASLTDDGQMLAIWTKEDDEAGRTKPRLDTPAVASVARSNEKRSSEATAGDVPSIDSELTPEKNYLDVAAKATASPSTHRLVPVHASRKKVVVVKLRSSISRREISQVSNFDTKARSTAYSHRHVGGYTPASTPFVIMNAGTPLYNSDYTQPFKNSKNASGP
jgi:hypothetical protein